MQEKWTEEKIEQLKVLVSEGKSAVEISYITGRTVRSIETAKVRYNLPSVKDDNTRDRPLRDLILKYAKNKDSLNVTDISNLIDRGPETVRKELEAMKYDGVLVEYEDNEEVKVMRSPRPKESLRIDVSKFFGKTIKFGAIGDTHLGSKYCRLDVLNALYDIFEKEGITAVYLAGNLIEGEVWFNKYDILCSGVDNQCNYFIENFPQRKGIKTYFVTGDDHEGWYINREQIDIGKIIINKAQEAGRDDLVYLGHMEADIVLTAENGQSRMRLIHAGGGSTYATSYTAQKIVESYQGGEKPDILLIGHYHKLEYGYPREVHCVQVGCTQDQTPFMRKKKIHAHVGGSIVTCNQSPDGEINRFKAEFITFFDKKFYEDKTFS